MSESLTNAADIIEAVKLKGLDAIRATKPADAIVEPSKEEKVYQLTVELVDTKQRKRDSAKGYNEEVKRIQQEIEALLADDKITEKTND